MNRIKLNVKTSKSKNLIYSIYRSTNQEELPTSLDKLQHLTPILVVEEATSTPIIVTTNEEAILDVSYIPTNNMIKYLLRYEPVKSDIVKAIISINFNNPDMLIKHEEIELEVTFDGAGAITNLVKTNKDKTVDTITTEIDSVITIQGQSISLNKDLVEGNYSITCSYSVEVIEVVDNSVAGIKKPEVEVEYKTYNLKPTVSVPYLRATPKASEEGIIYYYRIVATDTLGMVSYPSPLMSNSLSQAKDSIEYLLQGSKDYHSKKELAVWSDVLTVESGIGILIGRPLKLMYTLPSQLGFEAPDTLAVNEAVPVVDAEDVSVNSLYAKSDNRLILTVPNVWVCDETKYHSRPRNAYRVKALIGTEVSEYSDVIFDEHNAEINIEKMIVIKRNCTLDADPHAPSEVNQSGTMVIKTLIRKNGIYYSELEHNQCPYNIPYPYTDVALMSRSSVFNEITITDNACIPGQAYNYTLYLYDSFGNISEPTTIAVEA